MKLKELLSYDNITVQCHDFPDADSIASGYGVVRYLAMAGKKARLIYSGKKPITKPNLLHMTALLNIPIEYVPELYECETLVMVDCCYGEGNVTSFPAKNIFVIDHHRHSDTLAYENEIRSNYSSCSTIIASLLRDESFNYNDDRNLATALYYGLYTDSNGMNEINHAADRDLRDLTKFDELVINTLRNSNLSLDEMKIAGDALKHYRYNSEYRFAIVNAMPCDPNILGFISDLLLQVDEVDTCVVYCCMQFGVKLSVRSCINDIRANELAEFIADGKGSGGGHAQKAGGYLDSLPAGTDAYDYIRERMEAYTSSYTVINAADYDADISAMGVYRKKRIIVGYARSTDILAAGTEMCIRTLEADLNVCSNPDIYIMVGIKGEVYPIHANTFGKRYVPIEQSFTLNAEYSPSIINSKTFSSLDLMPYTHACMTNSTASIHAVELTSRIKVYTSWDKNNYMLGKKGDFLAVSGDDNHDIYVIERSIFFETYEPCE